MATTRPFFATPIDRTPYGACVGVVVIAALVCAIGAFGLLRLSGWVRHQDFSFFNLNLKGNLPAEQTGQELIDQIKQSVDQTTETQKDKAKEAATDAVRKEIQNQANIVKNEVQDQVKEGATNTVNNFLQ